MRKFIITIFFLLLLTPFCPPALAQDGVTLTITPPLIKNNVSPGQTWRSYIKIVNNNSFEIDAYVKVLDFKGGSSRGTVKFLEPIDAAAEGDFRLSHWLEIESGPYKIAPFESYEIPFKIIVPENASPGGHYAAILAGTKPPKNNTSGAAIRISSLLASLILLDVSGDALERGSIREFSANKTFYSEPKVKFTVRFENSGNVHIQPSGEIRIYNHFNKEKGKITLNRNSNFGNVLPNDIRRWDFSWEGENGLMDMGRYRARLTLGYGNRGRQSVDQTLYFWVIYFKPLLIIFGSLLLFALAIFFSIRRYIRKAVLSTRISANMIIPPSEKKKQKIKVIHKRSRNVIPEIKKIKTVKTEKNIKSGSAALINWSRFTKYIKIILGVLFLILILIVYLSYSADEPAANIEVKPEEKIDVEIVEIPDDDQREKEAFDINPDGRASSTDTDASTTGISLFATTTAETAVDEKEAAQNKVKENKDIIINVLNGGGKPGAAGDTAELLRSRGYSVSSVGNADNFNYLKTIIRFRGGNLSQAGIISKLFTPAAEVEETEPQDVDITVVIGKDYK